MSAPTLCARCGKFTWDPCDDSACPKGGAIVDALKAAQELNEALNDEIEDLRDKLMVYRGGIKS